MGRPKNEFPEPKKRFHKGGWTVYWLWDGHHYEVALGMYRKEDEKTAERLRRSFSGILAGQGEFLPPFDQATGVKNYLRDRFPEEAGTDGDWLEEYKPHLRSNCNSVPWVNNCISFLERLEKRYGSLKKVDQSNAQKFLDDMLATVKPATRNRALTAFSRFYKWAVITRRAKVNPFAGIGRLPERQAHGITYCTKEERERIINAALQTGRPDWQAVMIAFYGGCRREEIAMIGWSDVDMVRRRLTIPKSKNTKRRVFPLAKELVELFDLVPEGSRKGFAVSYPRTSAVSWVNAADSLVEDIRMRLCRSTAYLDDGTPAGVVGKRTFAKDEAALEGEPPENCPECAVDGGVWLPAERVGWTAWRHTFGSLLAQAGVSLDKISAWMGNTPDVCRRHYAEFIPRDSHDDEIELIS